MCLPGMLSREASKPNDRARGWAGWLKIIFYALAFVAGLRLLSFSLWSFFLDLALALYGLTFLKSNFASPDQVVMLESVLVLQLLLGADAAIGVLTLVSLVTETTILKVPITQWQQIAGYVVSGAALAVYLSGLFSAHMLHRALKETTLVTQVEASAFFSRGGGNVGRVAAVPTLEQRFPGQGYKLTV
jgi:hypothetical protein